MKYQVLSITLDKGNPVFLSNPFEMNAESISELGAKVADLFEDFGVKVKGINAVYRGDIEQKWEREPEKPNLFNRNGKDEEVLPKKKKPREKKPLLITDQSSSRFGQINS